MNSALRRLHERRQYRLHVFRVVCESLLFAAVIAALISTYVAVDFVSQL
jgi:hypothetical protein